MSNTLVPIVRVKDDAVYANSHDVAAYFGKQHSHVLRDIRNLMRDLSVQNWTQWFRPAFYEARVGFGVKRLPAYEMTKDGFALLVMGFTGLHNAGSTWMEV